MLILVFSFLFVFLEAQNPVTIHGIARDQNTRLPIEGVNIRIRNTDLGTTTNPQGIFKLHVRQLPVVLLISHIAYFNKQIVLRHAPTDTLTIFLNYRSMPLEEIEISAEHYKVFKGNHQEVIDYNFLDTNLVILTYDFRNNRHELILADEHFDTLSIKDISSVNKPEQIFKDCMGSCQLLTKDSAYQIFFDNRALNLIYPIQIDKFNRILGNCLFETRTCFAFKGKSSERLKTEYAAHNLSDLPATGSGNEKWKHLFFVVDKNSHEKIVLDDTYERQKTRDAFNYAVAAAADSCEKRYFGEILRFAEMAFFKPAFQTLKFLNDTIYYFNHLKSRIEIYSDHLTLIDTVHIDYHNRKNWKPVIITDKVKNKAYTIFAVGLKYSLALINLHNGSVKSITTIEKLFPQKIRVNNGYLYFLYRDANSIWGTKQLFQEKLF